MSRRGIAWANPNRSDADHHPDRHPVPQDERRERDEPQTLRLALAEQPVDLDRQEGARDPREEARDAHPRVPKRRHAHTEGSCGFRVLACGTQSKTEARLVEDVRTGIVEEERERYDGGHALEGLSQTQGGR